MMSGALADATTRATSASTEASARGRRMCHSRSAKNSSGTSMISACTSSGRQIVTAPVSTGSVSTRIAPKSAEKTCSGRCTRSKKRERGLKASLTEIDASCGTSSCCNTGSDERLAKVSDGSKSTGKRFVVATAAPVNILVAPGPTEAAHAKVARRRLMRAKADDSCTIACSLRAW